MSATLEAPAVVRPDRRPPAGFTLTELLIAAALSLVVMGAVASLFAILGRSIRDSHATVDLGARLRAAAWQLRQDLTGVTCAVEPWASPDENTGYFELIEGACRDTTLAIDAQGPTGNLSADTDDILLFTTQSLAGSFVGRYATGTSASQIESPFAEVAWFCRPSATQPAGGTTLYDLHRRQLLVVSYLGRTGLISNSLPITSNRADYDISLRRGTIDGQAIEVLLPNSLGDLTKRENRFMRSGYSFLADDGQTRTVVSTTFPFAFPVVSTTVSSGAIHTLAIPECGLDASNREREDVVLTNVIAFDVRVFDPQAAVPAASGTTQPLPGDPGYQTSAPAVASGAYVDLGLRGGFPLAFSGSFPPAGQSPLQSMGLVVTGTPRNLTLAAATYDTWPRHYEYNGVDDDGDGVIDEGSSGIEETLETETSPPYPVPLRGVEVRIRCYEPTSKQVRQVTIRHSFIR